MQKDSLFIFNENGMCQNPETIEVYRSGKDHAVITVAQAPNGYWYEGYDYACYTGGGGACPGPGQYRKPRQTRQEAINKALEILLRKGGHYERWHGDEGEAWHKFKMGIQKYIYMNAPCLTMYEPQIGRHGQLKLFFA